MAEDARPNSSFVRFKAPDKVNTKPTAKDLQHCITRRYATKWREIGVQLDLSEETLSIIQANNPLNVEGCCNTMLSKWLQVDTDASWRKLFIAIDNCTELYTDQDLQSPLSKKAKINTSILNEVQAKLKKEYEYWCLSDSPHHYVQLALVRDEICNIRDQKLNEITRHTLNGQVDEILKIKEPLKRGLEDIFHYNDLPCPRVILILGAPGIGKSTLANEICLKWAKDKDHFLSNDYDLVILIRLRTLQERTLQQMMIEAVGSEAAYDELLTKSHGKRCLIILEGLDEISADWQKNDNMFCQLVKNSVFLSHANILVTSRPHACIYLYTNIKNHSRTLEIVGFDKPQVKEYAELYLRNLTIAEKFMEQVNNNPHISSLCYVPLSLNMVLDCFKHNETIDSTLTELYQSFILSKVNEQINFKAAVQLGISSESDQSYVSNLGIILSDVPYVLSKEAIDILYLLSKLAYKSYFQWSDKSHINPKIIYNNKDLAHCNITGSENDACGLLKATNTLFAISNTAVYSFNHLSVQEYFCALYISLLPEDEQLHLLKNYITHYPHMWPFYAGIKKFKSPNVLHYLSQFLLYDKQQFERTTLIYYNGVTEYPDKNIKAVVALNSMYEAQVSSDECKDHLVSLFISMHRLSQYDYVNILYLISVAPITCLHLRGCNIGDQRAEVLLARCRDLVPTLKVLDLCRNNITDMGIKSLVKNTNLTHFSIACNPIGNAGIQLFSLKYLIQLNICDIGMTVVDTIALNKSLKVSNALQSLEISGNDIKDSGLTGILSNIPGTLVRLVVSHCHLTYNGAVDISDILRINETLKHLEISNNSIGDDGISAISDILCVNKILLQLVACNCEFQSKGAESISKMLQANETLKYLDISNNQIGDDGTTAVALSVQVNTTLILLNISNCGFCNQGAKTIAEMLQVNKTLNCLDISRNYIIDDEMSALAGSIRASTTLIKLRLSDTRRHREVHEFTNESLRIMSTNTSFNNFNNECHIFLDADFSSGDIDFEEWFIYDSINNKVVIMHMRSYCLPEQYKCYRKS